MDGYEEKRQAKGILIDTRIAPTLTASGRRLPA
jgi:hypothetical protein